MIKKADLEKDFSNKKIEDAIKNILIENSQENQNILIDEIVKTYLYTLIDIPSENEELKGVKLLKKIENKETYLPLFTNEDQMKDAKEKCSFEEVLLSFDEISNIVLDTTSVFKGFIINPDSNNIIIEDELVRYIIEKNTPKYEDGEINIELGEEIEIDILQEDKYPKDMLGALIKHFKTQKNITKSYIRLLSRKNEQSYLLITEFTGDKNETFKKISTVARPYLKDIFLDQLEYNTQFGQEATKDLQPFYKKKIFGII